MADLLPKAKLGKVEAPPAAPVAEPAPTPPPVPEAPSTDGIIRYLEESYSQLAKLGTLPGACYAYARAKDLVGLAVDELKHPERGPR